MSDYLRSVMPYFSKRSSINVAYVNEQVQLQSNLCTTTTLGTPNLWPLLTGGRCSEVGLCYEVSNSDFKMVVAVGRWLLFGGGR
jgi:hypothetical protein